MNKFFKITLYTIIGVVFIFIIFLIYFNSTYPKVDLPSNKKIEFSEARLERGKYLANHVTVCIDCHSIRDWTKYSGPVKPNTLGMGGEIFDENFAGVPGVIYSKNITPYNISRYSDGELMRVITNGVTKESEALFPLMPYMGYNKLTEEDLYSIIVYIRSLEPIKNEVPERSLHFPVNFLVKTIPPKSYNPSSEPDKNNTIEYGKYLVTIAGCVHCHTEMVKGEPVIEKAFAGGFEFNFPSGKIKSANITPDKETGIGLWTREQFIKRFKMMEPDSNVIPSVGPKDFNTPMPWTMYAGMTNADLGAIYDYLKTLKPIRNNVIRFTPSK
ncbi:MAG: hypothetical protein QHH13_09220 [Melioribacter sp.]|uniref:c-type cytochrome n=1 Tax=Rosettibacter primus TaxID=3111523 RepID=UPI00247DE536|nr:hypothetical protein [Melioribacter sp.]